MTRKALAEKAKWDEARAKGETPVSDPAPAQAPVNAPQPRKRSGKGELVPKSVEVQEPDPDDEIPWGDPAPAPAPAKPTGPAWQGFVIERITFFKGRTVGSLSESELKGLGSWMEKVAANWGGVDNDIKLHFQMISQRIEHDELNEGQPDQGPADDQSLQSDLSFQ